MNRWVKQLLIHARLIAWTAIIAVLCFTPGSGFKKVHIPIPFLDKWVHFVMFFALAFLIKTLHWKGHITKDRYNIYMLFAALYAGLIEIIQYYWVPMRSGDVVDWFFDLAGIGVSILVFKLWPTPIKIIFG